jgi:hypothetical protein
MPGIIRERLHFLPAPYDRPSIPASPSSTEAPALPPPAGFDSDSIKCVIARNLESGKRTRAVVPYPHLPGSRSMGVITELKIFFGPTLPEFMVNVVFLGYIVIANVWTWYVMPDMIPVNNPYINGMIVLLAAGGLLFWGLRGFVFGALLFPFGILFINAVFFPIYFICWLIALAFESVKNIPVPVAGTVGLLLLYLVGFLTFLFAMVCWIEEYRRTLTNDMLDDADDYSSPTFTGDLWGGRWG